LRGYAVVTLKQVAAHAEVSVQTVSTALNAPHRLRADTLQCVNRPSTTSTGRLLQPQFVIRGSSMPG
jgi:Bacterial regulatory proteins, lacI family